MHGVQMHEAGTSVRCVDWGVIDWLMADARFGPGKDFDGLHRKFRRRKFRAGAANFDEISMLSP